jgi:hypothetical protein
MGYTRILTGARGSLCHRVASPVTCTLPEPPSLPQLLVPTC